MRVEITCGSRSRSHLSACNMKREVSGISKAEMRVSTVFI